MGSADTPNADAPQARSHTGLKIAIGMMSVGILVMIVLLVLGFALGWGKRDTPPAAPAPATPLPTAAPSPAAPAPEPAANAAVTPLEIDTPRESRLYTLAGDGSRIALHIAAPTGDEIIVIDTTQNRIISRIRLKPEGGPTPVP